MGYYKDIDTLSQAKIDQTVRWWREHHGVVPDYLLAIIVSDDKLFERVSHEWELATLRSDPVMPSTPRVSRKESERVLRDWKREEFWSMNWEECRFITIGLIVSLTACVGLMFTLVGVIA